ncbi:EAL domain-containing protein [Vibrio owensii]|uniref:EAL domain-containing protein n=1 Tax=Vibrio owensii TaxID=696485 RepID=UPI0040681931
MFRKLSFWKGIILFLPLLLLIIGVFYVSSKSVQHDIDLLLEKHMGLATQTFSWIESESHAALLRPESCEALQQNLRFERAIDEMLIVKNDEIICSSKLGIISRPVDDYVQVHRQKKLSLGYIKGHTEQDLFLSIQGEKKSDYKAITIINRDYFFATIGRSNDPRLKRIVIFVGDSFAPLNSTKDAENEVAIGYSEHFDYKWLIEASDTYVEQTRLKYSLAAIPVLLVLYSMVLITFLFLEPTRNMAFELKRAIQKSRLKLYYQAQVDVRGGKIFGYEALIRWPHKQKGFIAPDKFIPLAEESGLIEHLTDFVLERACKDFSKVKFYEEVHLGVNIPPNYLSHVSAIKKIEKAFHTLKQYNVVLGIEITERQLIDKTLSQNVAVLRARGIQVLIDDFGKGQTALAVLQYFKIDYLKIDKCFIDAIGVDTVNSSVLSTIIKLGRDLHVELIAEGVETNEQAEYLKKLGVTIHQGYLYAKPLPYTEAIDCYSIQDNN